MPSHLCSSVVDGKGKSVCKPRLRRIMECGRRTACLFASDAHGHGKRPYALHHLRRYAWPKPDDGRSRMGIRHEERQMERHLPYQGKKGRKGWFRICRRICGCKESEEASQMAGSATPAMCRPLKKGCSPSMRRISRKISSGVQRTPTFASRGAQP